MELERNCQTLEGNFEILILKKFNFKWKDVNAMPVDKALYKNTSQVFLKFEIILLNWRRQGTLTKITGGTFDDFHSSKKIVQMLSILNPAHRLQENT